jgi:hypothetical protein
MIVQNIFLKPELLIMITGAVKTYGIYRLIKNSERSGNFFFTVINFMQYVL